MEITEIKINATTGKPYKQKVPMPHISQILGKIKQRGMFTGLTRYQYLQFDIDEALKIVEAIGKSRNPAFVIDNENRFVYENFVKWIHCDRTMVCLEPTTHNTIPGRMKRGMYIAGNTGSGKSWCLEIMLAYSAAVGFQISLTDDEEPRPLYWRIMRADTICDDYCSRGNIQSIKQTPFLGIQDLGCEPSELLYMGNRLDVMRQLLEYRGDKTDQLTFITSNMKINGEALNSRYGDRVTSRLNEMCNYFELAGSDRRK